MHTPLTLRPRTLVQEVLLAATRAGYTPLQSRLLAGRLSAAHAGDLTARIRPSVRQLDGPQMLPDIDVAADRIARAVVDREHLVLATDYDVDGCCSSGVLTTVFRDVFGHPAERLHHFSGHRMRDGYGVSHALTERIINAGVRPGLVCTADQGSNDHERITRLAAAGLDTVITDHHRMGEPPVDAVACVSPARADSRFPDPAIAGAHVAWLVCCAARQRLIQIGHLPESTPRLGHLLDLVACAAVADCTDLSRSINNRAVVAYGLHLMNTQPRPAWVALREMLGKSDDFTAADLGWTIGPMVNAAGRLDDSRPGLDFLLARDHDTALRFAHRLKDLNAQRRAIEAEMREKALAVAKAFVDTGASGIVVHLPDGHMGVHGIVASRVTAATGRPTACFSPKPEQPGMLTASLRSVPGIDIHRVLAEIALEHPNLQKHWGGHAQAAGSAIALQDIEAFTAAFDAGVRRQVVAELRPQLLTDGDLDDPSLALLPEIAALEPYGREFEPPVFEMRARILRQRGVGDGTHLKLTLASRHGVPFDAIWFSALRPGEAPSTAPGQPVRIAYELEANTYRSSTNLQLRVRALVPDPE